MSSDSVSPEGRQGRFLGEDGALITLVGPVMILALWAVITELGFAPPLLISSPVDTFVRLYELIWDGEILIDLAASIWRWGAGYLLGCVIGVPVGLLMGSSRWIYNSSYFVMDFFRSLPVTALFPLFLLFFGIGDGSKIAMAFTATVFVIILNSAYGVLQARKTRIRAAQVFGASRWQTFRWVIFYEALPQTMVGMRTSLSLALIVVIVSEMFIGTQYGLGQRVFDAYTVNLTVDLYAVLLLTGLLGFIMNKLFIIAENRIVFWAGK